MDLSGTKERKVIKFYTQETTRIMIQNCRPPRHQDSIENIPEKDLVYSDYISIFDVPDEEFLISYSNTQF